MSITHGITDGTGMVDIGEGVFVSTTDYETVRLPDELGGSWTPVISSHMTNLPDGRIGRYHTLAHKDYDAIALLNGDGILWIRKSKGDEEE
jgi:hypothetical protein